MLQQSQQAARIIAKFGGVSRLARAMGDVGHPRSRSSIHRWRHTRTRFNAGSNGIVPTSAVAAVKLAAAHLKIHLTRNDWAL